jgi:formylglycine-generating enzyme required for sulfatase activity
MNVFFFLLTASICPLTAQSPEGKAIVNSIGMKLVRIPPGQFKMGQNGPQREYDKNGAWFKTASTRFDEADWDERPVHTVVIRKMFAMSSTEVTNAQYEAFDPSHRTYRGRNGVSSGDDEAVTFVNWDDAVAFCLWLSRKEGRHYRLPTEAEWEYAARAGTQTLFHTGNSLPPGHHKWITDSGTRRLYYEKTGMPPEYGSATTLRVAQTVANAWGLYDMHGNVEEWCFDWHGPYEAGRQVDPIGRSDGDFRITRGGSHSEVTRLLRSANRSGRLPETRSYHIGFRVVEGALPSTIPLPPPPLQRYQKDVRQTPAVLKPVDPDKPFFKGPQVYMKVAAHSYGPLFSAHNHNSSLTECPNGDLLAVWYTCIDEPGDELGVGASRLRVGAQEWEDAAPFWDQPDTNDHAPRIWFDGKQTLYFFANNLTGNIVRSSTDNGVTWSKARLIQPLGEFGNRPFRTREGYIVVPDDERQLSFIISKDEGKTWTFTAHAPYADWKPEPAAPRLAGIHNAMVQLNDGRILALGRIDPAEIQERFHFRTPMSISADMGKTWQVTPSEFPAISSAQRAAIIRLNEGPLVFCSYTDQARDWSKRKGMTFRDSAGGTFTGYGLFAAASFDEGKTWPIRKLVTPGGPPREFPGTDQGKFTAGDTMAEWAGYTCLIQGRDNTIHLNTSKNHYAFNLAWLKQLPPPPGAAK